MSTWKISQWSMRFVSALLDNFSANCCSQIGEVEGSKADLPDPDSTESSGEVAPLDKVIIKKREKKEDRKSTEGRDLGSSPNIESA